MGLQETQSEKQSPFYYSNDEQSITVVLPNEIDYSDFSLYSVSCQTIIEKQPLYSNKEIVLSLPDGYNSGVYILSLSTSLTTYSMKILFK
ncbi:MAG: T9SS type A sorting domain-containing protein [Crocinitomix sp.]|nr:T9SS type A sorting domain-containing protein [Crocinitomix sp.]